MYELVASKVRKCFTNDKGDEVTYYRLRVTLEDGSFEPYYIDFKLTPEQLQIFKDVQAIDVK